MRPLGTHSRLMLRETGILIVGGPFLLLPLERTSLLALLAWLGKVPAACFQRLPIVTLLAGSLVTVVTLLPCPTEQADFFTVLLETVSAFGTVGLCVG